MEGVLKSAKGAGLDGLVITDHDCLSFALAVVERAKALDLVGIPGVEISTADGHLIGIGLETRPPSGLSFSETVTRVRKAGGLAVVPHPFQRIRHGVSAAAITDCDGIEVFNAHTLTGVRNRQAFQFAEKRGYPMFAGSDAHWPSSVGSAYTQVEVDCRTVTVESILDAMRAGRVRAVGDRISRHQYIRKLAGNAKQGSTRLLHGVAHLTGT